MNHNQCTLGDRVKIKWVKKAKQWCKTIIEDGKQRQEWFVD